MKTYAEATPYERMFMPTPPDDDPYWCSTQSVDQWVEIYQAGEWTNEELFVRMEQFIDGSFVPHYPCEIPLRIAAIQRILGLEEPPTGWVCPTCAAREKRKQKPADQAQTTLF